MGAMNALSRTMGASIFEPSLLRPIDVPPELCRRPRDFIMRSSTALSGRDTSANDWSDEDRRELESHRSDKHFRRLLDKLPAGAYLCDAEGLITYYNQQAVEVWGRAPNLYDSVDRFCGSFRLFKVDGTPIQHDECWMALALKHDREFDGQEIMIERPDGSRVIGLAHANPIHDDSGRLIGAVNVLVDITARKLAEDKLMRADRAKDEFLAMLSHELRNPLAPMRTALGVLRRTGAVEPEGKRALDVIDRQLHHMTHLVGDLLDISRINDGKLVLRDAELSLGDVVDTAIETIQSLIDEAGHELVVSLPDEPIFMRGDAHRLTQALSNVLNNAASFTPRGGRIELTLEQQNDEIVISVGDSGIGIPPDMLDGIFDIFVQADYVPDGSHHGLGVGLALTRHVLHLHGGTILAHSEGQGKGSTFTIRLPAPVVQAVSPSHVQANRASAPRNESETNQRVLVVDDNPDVIESMSMLLEIMNIDVRTASNGSEAIDLGETYHPDVILMDIGMPGMNGLECARAIRQKEWGKTANMIAVTGWGQEEDIQRSLEAGFDSHLVKPMDPDALMALFR